MNDIILELKDISKSFDDHKVLNGISIQVKQGEFVTLLGSSGCGKTTTLRIIAGLESPDAGTIYLHGEDITKLDPNKRDVNTIFQSYALFPHMNVEANIGYGLKIRKVKKEEIKTRVKKVLELVQLEGFEKRMPSELSGGQKQRVAIARAIINNPKLLLLDEPLGALDLQLRRQMQLELKRLQKKLGITFIYITHDQEEAINMSSRIVVMKDGQFQQIGTPDEIYYHPKTSYVAKFVGDANILRGTVVGKDGDVLKISVGEVTINLLHKDHCYNVNDTVLLAVRREHIEIPGGRMSLQAEIIEKSFAGGMLRMVFRLSDGQEIVASRQGINYHLEVGDTTTIGFSEACVVIVEDEENRGGKDEN
ncbi:MAG: ABC transporter ATP-binding protein [Clostridiales bacterium]|nr:ABC transporter ATP-binding protein [Clostridiales bacterium]